MAGSPSAEMESQIRDNDVDHVFVEFPDLNGLSRSKQLAADYFLTSWTDGFTMNLGLITQTPRSEVVRGSNYGEGTDFADALVHPDPQTCRLVPWRDDAARVICDIEFRDRPVEGAPRTVLKRTIERLSDAGFDAYVGSELEFFLLDPTDDGHVPATSDNHENLTQATEDIAPFYDRAYEWSDAFDLELTTMHHEYGAGQFEILFKHGEPLAQADRTFRFKELVKRAAAEGDQHATFMAKPFTDQSGNGYHLHVSLFENGHNVLAAADREEELSDRGRYFVGGLLEHADALTALGTPNINGFKRHQPNSFAPYTASWGVHNRMVGVRIPGHGTTRVENRIASGDANPYLVIAATLAAGLHGIEAELEPPEPSIGDPAGDRPTLPRTPRAAIEALKADDVIVDALGEEMIHEYVAIKNQEIKSFYQQTTAWERNRYIETL